MGGGIARRAFDLVVSCFGPRDRCLTTGVPVRETMSHRLRRRFIGLVGIVLIAGFLNSCNKADELSGTWMLDEASTAQGDLGPIKQVENAPYISMNDGEINGNAGCNAFAGTYEVRASSAIVFEDVFMELKGCDPVSNAYDLLFGEVFGGEVDLRMDSDSMIWTAAGNELRFVRSSAEDN